MMFTCTVCNTQQGRTFSKDSYQSGVVLIRCEGCDNLHLIADNLGWFKDEKTNIEDIIKAKGQQIFKFISNESMEFTERKENEDDIEAEDEHEHEHGEHCDCSHDHHHDHHTHK